jgi:hypothetical protein
VAALVVAAVGITAARCLPASTTTTPTTPERPTAAVSTSIPTAGNERPDRGEEGAIAAAVAFACQLQDWLYLDDAALAATIESIAAEGASARLVAEATADLGVSRDALAQSSGPVWWVVRPLASRVEHHRGDQAEVSVWSVSVLSAEGVAVPQADWSTTTYELHWERDAWRLVDVRESPGPTPQLGGRDEPAATDAFAAALEGFQRINGSEVDQW